MDQDFFNRYQRQMQLQSFGLQGQQKLSTARLLVVGLGGLGCPAAQYLVGAGVGKIGLVDGDNIEIHNLHRQVLYSTSEVGRPKVGVAKEKLSALNPTIEIETFNEFISQKNVFEIAENYDIILDGSDRFETRYLLDNFCTVKNKTYIYGSVFEFEGQVAVFNYAQNQISYNSLFPDKPKKGTIPSCAENGILGFLPGIIGSMQALEAVKYICNLKKENAFELIHYNALTQEIYKTSASPNKKFKVPQREQDLS